MVMHIHVQFQKLIEVKGFGSGNGHPHGIAKKIANVMIGNKAWVFGKDGALGWLFDVALERHQSFAPGFIEQVIDRLQRVEVAPLGEFRAAEYSANATCDLLENVHRVCYQDRPHGRAAYDQKLGGLDENADIAVFHQVTA